MTFFFVGGEGSLSFLLGQGSLEGGPIALSINIPRLKTEIEFFFEFDNDY